MKLQVEKYHVKYGGDERFIKATNIADIKITVSEVKFKDAIIKYKGFQDWSDWISTDGPVSYLDTNNL